MEQFEFLKEVEGGDQVFTKVVELATSLRDDAVDKEVGGLKDKNKELLDEKKQLQKSWEDFKGKFGDIDPDDALEAHKLVNSEEGKLLKEGKKLEELVEIKTSGMTKDFQVKLEELGSKLTEEQQKAFTWENKFRTKVVEDTLRSAAISAKVRPEAVEDVVMHGSRIFKMSDSEEVEARDKDGNLVKVGDLIATPKNWVESLKESRPHYWPNSEGGDLGGGGGGGSKGDIDSQILAAAKRNDVEEVRRLTNKKKEMKKG